MSTAVSVFRVVQVVVTITGLVWVLTGANDFFGGRNNNDSMRQEKGSNGMVNGAALGVIGAGVCQAIITYINSISM
ncbi:MAG: hypothetical protein HUJ62_08355 [Streptococcus gallolyticus]|nr:hypothetical protein [Streptococcus gallolyticus]